MQFGVIMALLEDRLEWIVQIRYRCFVKLPGVNILITKLSSFTTKQLIYPGFGHNRFRHRSKCPEILRMVNDSFEEVLRIVFVILSTG